MKRRVCRLLACSALGAVSAAHAAPFHPPGANLTYGDISHTQGVMGSVANPASAAAYPPGTRFGILSQIGIGYELGDLNEFVDAFDTFSEDFEDFERFADRIEDEDFSADVDGIRELSNAVETIVDVERSAEVLVQSVDENAFLGVTGGIKAPFAPIVFNRDALGGAFTFDAGSSFSGRLAVMATGSIDSGLRDFPFDARPDEWAPDGDDFTITRGGIEWRLTDDGGLERDDQPIDDIQDNTEVFSSVEALALTNLSLGYSARTYQNRDGTLYVGGRAHYYRADISRAAGDVKEDGDDAVDRISDDFSDNRVTENDFGIDLGVLWVARNFQVGLTGRNLNEPSFDYPDLDNFDDLPEDPRLERSKTYTLERQFTVEGSLHSPNRRWMLGASHDLNSVEGPHGEAFNNEYQWTAVGIGYASPSYFIPGFRLGYRTNNEGSELSYITGGLTLFRMLNIDAAVATDDVEEDGTSVPRSAFVNVGLEFAF